MKGKILVVDDDVHICELVKLYLEKEEYEVVTAHDGGEGLENIQRHTDSVMSIMPHVQRRNRKASFRDTAGALIHLTVHSR